MRAPVSALLLLGLTLPVCAPGAAQAVQTSGSGGASGTAPVSSDNDDEDQVVITGHLPGAVIGNIPPQDVLRARDLHATGATNLNDLLAAIAPEIGTAADSSASRPIVLLNGRRISSFRELRDLPMEAIDRVDILPEEVALKYGYRLDQKVINVVLKNGFKSTVGQIAGTAASRGPKIGGNADVTRLELDSKQRTTLNAHIGGDDILSAAQRSVVPQPYDVTGTGQSGFAVPLVMRIRAGATVSRELPGNVETSYNAEVEHDVGHSLSGLSEQLPAELNRDTKVDSLHLGAVANGGGKEWHWNITGTGDVQHENTETVNAGAVVAAGSARSLHSDMNIDATMNGPLFNVPAGAASVTLHAGSTFESLQVDQQQLTAAPSEDPHRLTALGGLSVDVPITSSKSVGGAVALNGNAEVDRLSDFGSLTRVGVGANWSPMPRVSLIASWSRDEDAPSLRQIGAALLETPDTPIFDFTNGIVARPEVLTGGNRDLRPQSRDTLRLSGEWQPLEDPNLRIRAEYARVQLHDPISNLTVSPELEAAFPDRFVRDTSGNLLSADLRPVNFRSAQRDTLRVGFDFSKALRSRRPSREQVAQVIDKARAAGIAIPELANAPANVGPTTLAQQFSNTGRITFSLTDTITLSDRATVEAGLPALDYLHGAAVGQTGGQPIHQLQAQIGYFKNGIGGRLGANVRSATRVDSLEGDSLRFSALATFDLRLFANVGQDVALVVRHPWLAGTSVRLEALNMFNTQPRVHNSAGAVPIGYSPSFLDPFGRTVMLSIRKQFLPISYYRDQLVHFEQDQLQQSH